METLLVLPDHDLDIKPSATSSANDFDFLCGNWTIINRRLKERFAGSTEWIDFPAYHAMGKILLGIGNTDIMSAKVDGKPFEGMSLRLFNPKTRLWSIYWADSNHGTLETPVVGSFDGNIGVFYARDTFRDQAILMKFNWDKSDQKHPVWSQAFSADEGQTWEWNWHMYFSRPAAKEKQ